SGTVTFSTQGSETSASLSEGAAGIKAEKDETTGVTSVTISAPGEYSLTGEAVNTYITVAKGLSDGVILNLDSLTIDDSSLCSATGKDLPVIAVKKSGSVVTINLIGESSLKGSSSYAEDPEALIKAPESTLTIQGSGTLNISNTPDDAIKAKNGTINITSGKIYIVDEIYGDGIQAENVNISGGEVNIATVFNNAATGYYTSGSNVAGMNTITEDERSGLKTERINVNLGDHAGIKVGTKESTRIYKDLQSSDPDNATETYEASGSLNISGGTVNIDTTGAGLKASGGVSGYTACSNGVYVIGAPDDAIKSNNDISITGGTITINSSDDGISAANNLTITGSGTKIDIKDSFEGIEGAKIVFGTNGETTGPAVTINSKDDGINAAHKSNVTYTYDSSEDEDCNYTKTTTKTAGNSCTVYSGTVIVKIDSTATKSVTLRDGSKTSTKTVSYRADGDGIDCNGTLDLEGGTTYVFGASPSTSNSPIDTDSGFTLGSNATVLAVGSDGMNESTPRSGNGVYFTYGSGMSGGSGFPGGQFAQAESQDQAESQNQAESQAGTDGEPPAMPGGTQMPGGPGGTEGPGTPGGTEGPVGPGENQTATIAAGSIFKVISGTTTIIEEELPYAASFLLYGSPAISGTTGYTATLNGTVIKTSEGTPSENPTPQEPQIKEIAVEMVRYQKTTLGTGSWSTSDKTVVAVTAKTGVATAKKAGTATLTNTGTDGGKTVYKVTVHVPSMSVKKLTLLTGDSGSVLINDTGDMEVTFTSSNRAVFSVSASEDGKTAIIKAVGKGSAKLKAVVGTKTYTTTVTVVDKTSPVKLADRAEVTLNVYQTYKPKFTNGFKAAKATWTEGLSGPELTLLKKNVLTDSNGIISITKAGNITALKCGTVTLGGVDKNGKQVEINITVKAIPVKTDLYIKKGKTVTYKNTFVTKARLKQWLAEPLSGSVTLTNTDKAVVKIKAVETGDVTLICECEGMQYITVIHVE
ncbi:MAG: carbohydrate-binding domain-containing protein, partial [Lachnospiraceae bacterium]|nr:carbohydrate-binding domain-containing protein [Lachnospiraceae bacterium]